MAWRSLFNTTTRVPVSQEERGKAVASAAGDGGGADAEVSQGVFITPQALVTFPVASFIIGLFWKVTTALVPSLDRQLSVPFVISLIVGGFIYWVGVSDPATNYTSRDKKIAAFVGLVNAIYLFGATTGIATIVNLAGNGAGGG